MARTHFFKERNYSVYCMYLPEGGGGWSEPQAFVRWHEKVQQGEELMEQCGFTPLQVEKTQRDSARGGKITVDFTDLVNAKNVLYTGLHAQCTCSPTSNVKV